MVKVLVYDGPFPQASFEVPESWINEIRLTLQVTPGHEEYKDAIRDHFIRWVYLGRAISK